jgi:prepilin-type N-terminal cleavage/methylation domain-containing protein
MLTACTAWEERLSAYLDDELGSVERLAVEKHLAECPTCRAALEMARCDAQDVAAALGATRAGDGFADRVMAQIAVTPQEGPAPTPPPKPKPAFGFRLIELLVVLAVIAVLASMLFPVFAKAREKSRQTTCLSNVRQMSTALAMYLQDNGGRFPQAATWVQDIQNGGVSEKMLCCPSGKNMPGSGKIDYAYNVALSGKSEQEISNPSEYLAIWCTTFNHAGTMLGFADGHAKYYPGIKSIDDYKHQEMQKLSNAHDLPAGSVSAARTPEAKTPAPAMSDERKSEMRVYNTYATPPTPTIVPPTKNYGLADKLQIAYEVNVALETDDVKGATEAVEALLTRHDGFILTSSYQREVPPAVSTASVNGRVPSEQLGKLLVALDRVGLTLSRTVSGEDLTATHLSHLESLNDLQAAQSYLTQIEKGAKKTPDALNAENQRYDKAREASGTRVDAYKLKMRVTLADVTVQITGKAPKPVVDATHPFTRAASRAWHALGAFGLWLGGVLIPLLIWLPLWGPLLGIALMLRKRLFPGKKGDE